MQWQREARVYSRRPAGEQSVKVSFPSLDHFLEEVVGHGLRTVRMDVFAHLRDSELSFIRYLCFTLYVTALDRHNHVIYEYAEDLGTQVSTDAVVQSAELDEAAILRRGQVEKELHRTGLTVGHGRYVASNDES